MNKIYLIIKKSPISLILTIVSFIIFIFIYLYINLYAIESYFVKGLIFMIPFLSFGIISFLTIINRINKLTSNIISFVLIFVLGFVMFITFILISVDAATSVTTDEKKYQKVLRIINYPEDDLTKYFPNRIPNDAKNIQFYYHPAFMQGGEVMGLRFEIDSSSIDNYINKFKYQATWTVNTNDDLSNFPFYSHTFNILGYSPLPEDFTIYIFISENSNHGEISLVAISKEKNEIIFYSDNW